MRLVYIALGWIAGIILAANNDASPPLLWLALAVLAILAVWIANPGQRTAMVVIAAFMLGGLRFALFPKGSDIERYINTGGLTVEGVVATEPDIRDNYIQLQLDAETVTRGGQIVPTGGRL